MNCAHCGREFTPVNSRARYCSARCKREVFNESRRSKRVLPPRKCVVCGTEFSPRDSRQRACSRRCSKLAWNRAHGIGGFSEARVCAFCGKPFVATRPDRRFCSDICGKRAYLAAHRVVIEPRKCLTCGREFTPTHHKRARFCCAACRAAYHNKRMERAATGAADVDMTRVEAYLRLPTSERWQRRKELNAAELKAAERMWNEWHREVV